MLTTMAPLMMTFRLSSTRLFRGRTMKWTSTIGRFATIISMLFDSIAIAIVDVITIPTIAMEITIDRILISRLLLAMAMAEAVFLWIITM